MTAPDDFAMAAREHRPALLRLAVSLCDDRDAAADAVQEALADAWARRADFDPARGELGTWLLGIVYNRARRRRRRTPTLPESVPFVGPREAVAVDLRAAVRRLAPRQREAVVLTYYVDLPVASVAALMDCSPGTVKSTLHDARRALAELLGAGYAD